ncbi:CynX/NimT family MFS transporter [Leekyejoonella antrihumi]|uniref:MFS transporter n=1 Tax=Leekyejoonella antrihumi TaxID=1660198 RepID=A0A563E014_9MICO|nr:MFS transporter [Leekyejoonella antrihumi]TWP35846.1 MFS transporter [Leekyejoonella antrihumi]
MIVAAVSIMLVAANLRPAVVAISPLLGDIRHTQHLGGTGAGLLTTLPVLCFGLMAPVAPRIGRRLGIERAVFLSLLVLLAGVLVRLLAPTIALFIGTLFVGVAIGVVNVLLPALIKRDFSTHAGVMTGLYSMTLSCGAAVAAGLTVPIRDSTGWAWRPTLAVWALLVVAALVLWVPQTLGRQHHVSAERPTSRSVGRNRIAWALTIYMGMQSLVFYTVIAWLPAYFSSRGVSDADAGWMLALFSIVGTLCSLVMPIIATRMRDQRLLAVGTTAVCGIGLLGLVIAPAASILWVCLIGIGPGTGIGLALLMMVLRASTTEQTSQLSGMAQTIGYVLAAVGPILIGALHDATHSWSVALVVLAVFVIPQGVGGLVAGADRRIPA